MRYVSANFCCERMGEGTKGTKIWIDSVMRPRSSSRGAIQVPQLQLQVSDRFGTQVVYLSFGYSCRLKTDAAMYGIE